MAEPNGDGDLGDKIALEYSDAYDKIIENGDGDFDLVGIIAYALYKKQKREFILRKKIGFDHEQVRNYHLDLNDGRVASLRQEAENILTDYADQLNDRFIQESKEEVMNSELLTNIRGTVKASTNIWKAIAASVAASFVFGLVLTAAQLVQWQNPFNSIPKSGAPVTVQDGKSPPPKTP